MGKACFGERFGQKDLGRCSVDFKALITSPYHI